MNRENSLLSKAKTAYDRDGMWYVVKAGLTLFTRYPIDTFWLWYYKTSGDQTFIFQQKAYRYFYSKRGRTWETERAVEIPIVFDILTEYSDRKANILEVGNVLSSRFNIEHDVIDKYEIRIGVINEDVVDFKPQNKKYLLIFSISTLEHVGWDEKPRDPDKIIRAVRNLEDLLAVGGKLLVTLPIGQNPYLDSLLKRGVLRFKDQYYMIRKPKTNEWREATWHEVENSEYNWKIPAANAIFIGVTEKLV